MHGALVAAALLATGSLFAQMAPPPAGAPGGPAMKAPDPTPPQPSIPTTNAAKDAGASGLKPVTPPTDGPKAPPELNGAKAATPPPGPAAK